SGSSTFSYTVRSPIRLNAWKMKPISRLRIRARSEKERAATCFSFRVYLPSLGVSSRPRIDSRVVLPQPEGPAIETYSPLRISMWIPDRAWVSTSSVRNTLVTPSRRISGSADAFIGSSISLDRRPIAGRRFVSVQPYLVVTVLRRGVREDHLVAGLQTLDDFHGVDGGAAQLDRHPHRLLAVLDQLEQLDLAVGLADGGAADVEDVLQAFDLDGAVYREVRPGARGQRTVERHVHHHRAVLRRRGDPQHAAGYDHGARVDRGAHPHLHVLGLHLGDAQLGLELFRPGHPRQHHARRHALAHLHRQLLELAGDAGPHLERVHLPPPQLVHGAHLVHPSPLGRELRVRRAPVLLDALALDAGLLGELARLQARQLQVEIGDEPVLGQPLVGLLLQVRLRALRLRRGELGLLAQQLVLELRSQLVVVRLRRLELRLGLQRALLDLRIAHLQQHRVGGDLDAGQGGDPLDPALDRRRDPAHVLRHQRAGTAHLTQHEPTLDGVDQDRLFLDRRRRRLQADQPDRDQRDHRDARHDEDVPPQTAPLCFSSTRKI